ncbi:MAG: pilus assembly protein PilM [Candidatus Colwellbacteria bacterium]|nr:pilus assembly protein PilM [Candidatus Colwellbacteria bacterium]
MKKIDLGNAFYLLNKVLMPPSTVGGLQITNSIIRFLELAPSSAKGDFVLKRDVSLRLPPGILESNRIKDTVLFIQALKELRKRIGIKPKKLVDVILTIPAGDVFVQAFTVPILAEDKLKEAVDLNLKAISPIPIDRSYYSARKIGKTMEGGGQYEFLGTFVQQDVMDEFADAVEVAGFGIAAVEFSSVGFARTLISAGAVSDNKPYLIVKITQDGVIFLILKNGELYFNYFHPWEKIMEEGGGVSLDSIFSVVRLEMQRLLNFYSQRSEGRIKDAVIISPAYGEELANFIYKEHPYINIQYVNSQQENFHGVRGAAERGLLPRHKDTNINLMGPHRLGAYLRNQILAFVVFWRSILAVSLGFLLALFISANIILTKEVERSEELIAINLGTAEFAELDSLKASAAEFNDLVKVLQGVRGELQHSAEFIDEINNARSGEVVLERLNLNFTASSGLLRGNAVNERAILAFRDRLLAMESLEDINMPLADIVTQPTGRVAFLVSFRIVGSDSPN